MNVGKFMTVAECDEAIAMFRKMECDIPQDLLDRREYLSKRGISVYDDFVARNNPSEEMSQCIERATNALLDPAIGEAEAKKPVMLYGKIQSGKTRTFVGIMSRAFDRGADVVIVYTKGTNALAQQTVSRMKSEFRNFAPSDNLAQQCTIVVHDVLELRTQMLTPYEISAKKHIIVCKKESNNTRLLEEIFRQTPQLREKSVILIDDEADFGGISFYKSGRSGSIESGANAQNITNTVNLIPNCRNMLVTATPYSLYLQPDGVVELVNGEMRALRPRHTETVPEHPFYIGGQQYFVDSEQEDSMYHSVFHPMSQDCVRVLGKRDVRYLTNVGKSPNLGDFRHAVLQYLLGTAIRSIQEESVGKRYKSSFIVHVKIDMKAHKWQAELLNAFCKHLGSHVFAENGDDASFDEEIEFIYEDFVLSWRNGQKEGLAFDNLPQLASVRKRVNEFFSKTAVNVQIVNSKSDVESLLDANGQLELRHVANIFVGGSILDRGITIANLIGFVYGRSPQRMQSDTVLQHARMYGARSKEDMAVTRFHTTVQIFELLKRINAMDDVLRNQFATALREGRDMRDVFVCRAEDGRILPCAPNKLLMSSLAAVAPEGRYLPIGFQTGSATAIRGTVSGIDNEILALPEYAERDEDGIFTIDRNRAADILRRIRKTYIYDRPIDENEDCEWNVEETIGILEWALNGNDWLYCLRRDNREMKRYRENGGFIDAPDDGRMDLAPAKAKANAGNRPVLMLIRENGDAEKGWRGTPFYWPVLLLQKDVRPAIYGLVGQRNVEIPVIDEEDLPEEGEAEAVEQENVDSPCATEDDNAGRIPLPTRNQKSNFSVLFPDGTEVSDAKASQVFSITIAKLGPARVEALGLLNGGEPLVSQDRSAFRKYPSNVVELGGGWFVNSHSSTAAKIRWVNRLAESLGVRLVVNGADRTSDATADVVSKNRQDDEDETPDRKAEGRMATMFKTTDGETYNVVKVGPVQAYRITMGLDDRIPVKAGEYAEKGEVLLYQEGAMDADLYKREYNVAIARARRARVQEVPLFVILLHNRMACFGAKYHLERGGTEMAIEDVWGLETPYTINAQGLLEESGFEDDDDDGLIPIPPPPKNASDELYLTLAYAPYDAIKRGEKKEEYRDYTPNWVKKILSHEIRTVRFQRGYGGPGHAAPEQMVWTVSGIDLVDSETGKRGDPFDPPEGLRPDVIAIRLGRRVK